MSNFRVGATWGARPPLCFGRRACKAAIFLLGNEFVHSSPVSITLSVSDLHITLQAETTQPSMTSYDVTSCIGILMDLI